MKYLDLKEQFPHLHEIVAVSKTFDCNAVLSVFKDGFRHFGENKVQELILKKDCHPDIIWHLIGHLQSNKIKDVDVDVIGIDNLIDLEEIETKMKPYFENL